ncbi:MAG: PEFG-CTERM sorting domain-containing protein [Nanoarchaeota archaeon]|nr:PEFG-CTERM sorting domain-containing protein [Nanoarchaeota archaeon]
MNLLLKIYKYYDLGRYDVNIAILSVLILSLAVTLSFGGVSFAEKEIKCVNCVQIPSYEIDLYKEIFPLTVWTDSRTYDHSSTITVTGYLKPQNTVAPILAVVTNPIGNIVTIQQISPDTDGNFSFKLNTSGPLWSKDGEYILKVQSGAETRQFKTNFNIVPSLTGNFVKCASDTISTLANNGRIYCIPYTISDGLVSTTAGKLNSDVKTITLDIKGQNIGTITLDIPRYILDSKSSSGDDSAFVIMANGKMIEYQELESDSDSRQIKLDYPIGNKATFEIVGTHIIPEFGSIALLILVASITSILIVGKSFSNRLVRF